VRGGTIDCNAIPDAAMTLAIVALFADAPTTLVGIGSWRVKETDRLAAHGHGASQDRRDGGGGRGLASRDASRRLRTASIATYDDHRMAMCFSLASLAGLPLTIEDPACVRKTFPDYFSQFAKGGHVSPVPSSPSMAPQRPAKARSPRRSRTRSAFTTSTAARSTRLVALTALRTGTAFDEGRAARQLRGAPRRRLPWPARSCSTATT
jgi:3-phosphoshikimate 1-carboxyvinyltransferase